MGVRVAFTIVNKVGGGASPSPRTRFATAGLYESNTKERI